MIVRDLMRSTISRIGPAQPLSRALRRMDRDSLDALVVLRQGRIAGILTRSDIEKVAQCGRSPEQVAVAEAMSDEVLVSYADEPVEQCVTRMAFHGVERMPVVEEKGRLLGIVTLSDIRNCDPRQV